MAVNGFADFGLTSSRGMNDFPSPWNDYASSIQPSDMRTAFYACEMIYYKLGPYREACERLIAYFITDIEPSDGPDELKSQWKEFIEEDLDIRNVLKVVGTDLIVYGNEMISVLPLFYRYLSCPKCSFETLLRTIYDDKKTFNFLWSDYEPHATCPRCKYRGSWGKFRDRKVPGKTGFVIKRWNVKEIDILHDIFTGKNRYIWRIPEDYKQKIRQGHLHYLENVNQEVIQAIKENQFFMFEEDVIYHMREDALAGVRNRGWGISKTLSNFSQAFYVQVLHRQNEAIALDYVTPFRVITPADGRPVGAESYLGNQNLGDFSARVQGMLRKRRRDPASWHVLPLPIQYTALGGDASKLAPKELIEYGMNVLLTSTGLPQELFTGSLSLQSAPVALRLFEATKGSIPHNFNNLLRFIVKQIAKILSWEPIKVKLQRVSHADDVQKSLARLQLSSSGALSQTTGLKTIGVDYAEEIQRMIDEQRLLAQKQEEAQEQTQKYQGNVQAIQQGIQNIQPGIPQQQGQPQPGTSGQQVASAQGMPGSTGPIGGVGGNQKVSPEDILSTADAISQQLLMLPASQRISELKKLKQVNPLLHSVVTSKLDSYRNTASLQGRDAVLQQQFGQQG